MEIGSVSRILGAPEYVVCSVFVLVATRTCWTWCEIELKEVSV